MQKKKTNPRLNDMVVFVCILKTLLKFNNVFYLMMNFLCELFNLVKPPHNFCMPLRRYNLFLNLKCLVEWNFF